ncbi:hypothetical protein CKAH01_04624 [Colletotrichum kahawae]|uniref:Uncharacterized protein n=1 Tax=Colletotrichum kahawae TaxID=34407 RepID=A0AAE0D864_COLKA|nr:hypothetical protein CKAH01_04624 [Colletotrichum kahawae]
MPAEEYFIRSQWRQAKSISRSLLRFSRSIIAEYFVYALLFYSTTAVVTFFVFLPIDCLDSLLRGESSRSNLIDFQSYAFLLPLNNFTFTTFSLPTRIFLVAIWALTARPALALAGYIVQQQLPAYAYPPERYPPTRWLFETICSFANRHHVAIPDVELYTRRVLRTLGARLKAGSYKLGTISPREHGKLRRFERMYGEVIQSFSERSKEPELPELSFLPLKFVEVAHYKCADEVLQQRPVSSVGYSDNYIPSSYGAAQSVSLPGTTWIYLDWEQVRSDAKKFTFVYVMIVFYWLLRDFGGFLLPSPLLGRVVSSAQEWYNRHIAPTVMPSQPKQRDPRRCGSCLL